MKVQWKVNLNGFFREAFCKTGEAWLMKQSTTFNAFNLSVRPNKILIGSPWLSRNQSEVILHYRHLLSSHKRFIKLMHKVKSHLPP